MSSKIRSQQARSRRAINTVEGTMAFGQPIAPPCFSLAFEQSATKHIEAA
jgi:hypothetical protein